MGKKDRKKIQLALAKENMDIFFDLLEKRFRPDFDKEYIKEILRFSTGFNLRLTREQKLKFCKKCHIYWNVDSREIRFNSKTFTKEYICKNCGFIRRFRYK